MTIILYNNSILITLKSNPIAIMLNNNFIDLTTMQGGFTYNIKRDKKGTGFLSEVIFNVLI